MEKINYPLDVTEEEYDTLTDNLIKIKTIKNDFCILHAFLNSTCSEYQNSPEETKKIEILDSFKYQLKEFLKAPSTVHNSTYFVKKIMSAYEISNMKDKYSLVLRETNGNIFDIIMVKNEKNLGRHYSLFSQKTMNILNPTSNFFDVLSLNFLRDMIDQRFLIKSKQEDLKYMEDQKKEAEEIIHKMQDKNLLLDPCNLFYLLDHSECLISNILIRFLGEIFDVNFFICRGWKLNITVLEEVLINESYPYIILFKTSGPVSITGIEKEIFYESGGSKDLDGIKTILNDNKMIEKLKENLLRDLDTIIMKKYNKYLKSMFDNYNLPILKEEISEEDPENYIQMEEVLDNEEEVLEEEKREIAKEKEEIMEEDPENYIQMAEEIDEFDPENFVKQLKEMK